MQTTTIYNNLLKMERDYMEGNYKEFIDNLNKTKKAIYNDLLKTSTTGTVKKAVSQIQKISKKMVKKNPTLQYCNKLNFNGVGGFVFTDSYFLSFTLLQPCELIPNASQYPKVERIMLTDESYYINLSDLDYSKICLNSKMKDIDDKLVTFKTYYSTNNQVACDITFNSDYIKLACDLLDFKNNINNLVFTGGGKNKPFKLLNTKTQEFVIVLPIYRS